MQGMMANRYMNTFRDEILGWNKKLMNVADVNQIITEIQRTWAYLESLFIHSEEVKKELPEAAVRFANIDKEVKIILKVWNQSLAHGLLLDVLPSCSNLSRSDCSQLFAAATVHIQLHYVKLSKACLCAACLWNLLLQQHHLIQVSICCRSLVR